MNIHESAALPTTPMQPLQLDNLLINFTTEFYRVWDTQGSRAKPAAFWRPTPAPDQLPGYFPLGDVAVADLDNINGKHVVAVVCEKDMPSGHSLGKALRQPVDFELIWRDAGSKSKKDGAVWRPIPPQGYVALGSVCSNDHEKPSLNAIRCVREDLVIASRARHLIWSDKGSGAKQSLSTWSIAPPNASPGEIYLAPGTFIGEGSYSMPEFDNPTWSLRLPISLQINPQPPAPELIGERPARLVEPAKLTHTALLPWFTVSDPQLSPLEQLRHSPSYRLERTDQFMLIGYGNNTQEQGRTLRWTVPRAQRTEHLQKFARLTAIEIGSYWSIERHTALPFSAKLDEEFVQCGPQANEWFNARPLDVIALATREKSIAAYLIQSSYTLLREDGTPVTEALSYTDSHRLHLCEYSAQTTDFTCPPIQLPAPSMTDQPISEPAAENVVPEPTDSAP